MVNPTLQIKKLSLANTDQLAESHSGREWSLRLAKVILLGLTGGYRTPVTEVRV